MHVENIQMAYERQFPTANENHHSLNDVNQYFAEVEKIYTEFSRKMLNAALIDEKKFSIEPFCMINVDESTTVKVNADNVDNVSMQDKGLLLSPEIKEELGQMSDEPNCVVIASEPASTDVFSVDEHLNALSNDEDDEIDDYDDDDDDESEYGNENESESDDESTSSDTSDEEINEKQRKKSNIKSSSTKQARTAKKRSEFENRSSHRRRSATSSSKKHVKKISVTTVNVLDENNKRLLSYVQMKCDKCSDDRVYETFAEVQTHFLDTHQQKGYIMCCNRKFRRIGRVLQHCTWHDNPEAFKCDTCNKCFQDNVCLRDHITSMHIPADERRFQCEQCNRLFAKQHLLNTHLKMKHTVKEERPFVCTEGECGQRFVLPAYLRLHIEKVHNKSDSR